MEKWKKKLWIISNFMFRKLLYLNCYYLKKLRHHFVFLNDTHVKTFEMTPAFLYGGHTDRPQGTIFCLAIKLKGTAPTISKYQCHIPNWGRVSYMAYNLSWMLINEKGVVCSSFPISHSGWLLAFDVIRSSQLKHEVPLPQPSVGQFNFNRNGRSIYLRKMTRIFL